jgi:hypothetical protein
LKFDETSSNRCQSTKRPVPFSTKRFLLETLHE